MYLECEMKKLLKDGCFVMVLSFVLYSFNIHFLIVKDMHDRFRLCYAAINKRFS